MRSLCLDGIGWERLLARVDLDSGHRRVRWLKRVDDEHACITLVEGIR